MKHFADILFWVGITGYLIAGHLSMKDSKQTREGFMTAIIAFNARLERLEEKDRVHVIPIMGDYYSGGSNE